MSAPYGFGISQEDERTEAAALGLPGGRVLSVAGAGDMPLSLLALGADEVVAVDVAINQLHLAELKLAAVLVLDREDAIRFLGFMPAEPDQRRRWLAALLGRLPAPARDFWRAHDVAVRRGPIWAGRYERYLAGLRTSLRPIAGRHWQDLCACETLDQQQALFGRHFDRPLLRAVFRLAFAPRLYGDRGLDPRGLQHHDPHRSLGLQFFDRFRAMCVTSPVRENPLLQLHLCGRVPGCDVVPEYLTEHGTEVLRRCAPAITFVHASIQEFLDSSAPERFDRFHLSNITDWLPAAECDRLFERIAGKAAHPARLVWRYLHARPPLPPSCSRAIHVDEVLAGTLVLSDRFPFYGIVPAEIPV
jgi:S-adenosylmethionine-diacylglycerol 3-amino-3-carboxypropyl transferase